MSGLLGRLKAHLNLRQVGLLYALPLILSALYAVLALLSSINRWDPAFFGPEYQIRYALPGQVMIDTERAIRLGDDRLLAELQGRRRPVSYEQDPDLSVAFAWEINIGYRTYLYLETPYARWRALEPEADFITYVSVNEETFRRLALHTEHIRGRWVLTPADARFYLLSGRWLDLALPLALTYWLVLTIALAALWVYRASRELGDSIYMRPPRAG